MRVITGTARGIRLETPAGTDTRPTTEKVKEAVFSSVAEEIYGASVLDLFAGSGQMGIEALSRGAARCDFVDHRTGDWIEKNLKKTGLGDRGRVYKKLPSTGRYQLVFMDPPYNQGLNRRLLAELLSGGYLAPGALILAESDREPEPLPEGLVLLREKHYGRICIAYIGYHRGEEN